MIKKLEDTVILKLDVHEDERGWLAEILHGSDLTHKEFGQLLVTTALPGETKGGHYHTRKEEWFCVIGGKALLTLIHNETGEKREIEMGEGNMATVNIPLNVMHWIKNTGDTMMYLLAYTNEEFDPEDTDTYYE